MSTVRLAVSAIVDAHGRVILESPVNAGVNENLRSPARQLALARSSRGRLMRRRRLRSGQLRSYLCRVRSRSLPEHVHSGQHPTKVLPRSWQIAGGLSITSSLCSQVLRTQATAPFNVTELVLATVGSHDLRPTSDFQVNLTLYDVRGVSVPNTKFPNSSTAVPQSTPIGELPTGLVQIPLEAVNCTVISVATM